MYETLDNIADAYTPALLIAFIVCGVVPKRRKNVCLIYRGVVFLIGALIISYGLMWLDHRYEWFNKFALDYSTHTAVALSGVLAIYVLTQKIRFVSLSFVAYVLLMLYQEYHTLADIVSTMLVLSPFMGVHLWLCMAMQACVFFETGH